MLVSEGAFSHQALLSNIILPILHKSFLGTPPEPIISQSDHLLSPIHTGVQHLTPTRALSTLLVILTNTDPSPPLISILLSPILPALYSALSHLDSRKASDPNLRESLRGIMETWGRLVGLQEGVDVLWSIVAKESDEWEIDDEGELRRVAQ
jgi:hypothetical protein